MSGPLLSEDTLGESETEGLAARLMQSARPGEVYGLVGPLGAGKTVFVRGAVRGLGGDAGQVRSPTFTLMNRYEARIPVHHFDFYRLTGFADLEGIGFDEFTRGEAVAFVEWADRIPEVAETVDWVVTIEFGDRPDRRRIRIQAPVKTSAQ